MRSSRTYIISTFLWPIYISFLWLMSSFLHSSSYLPSFFLFSDLLFHVSRLTYQVDLFTAAEVFLPEVLSILNFHLLYVLVQISSPQSRIPFERFQPVPSLSDIEYLPFPLFKGFPCHLAPVHPACIFFIYLTPWLPLLGKLHRALGLYYQLLCEPSTLDETWYIVDIEYITEGLMGIALHGKLFVEKAGFWRRGHCLVMAGDGVLVSIGKDELTSLYFPVCIQNHTKSKLLFF